MWCKEGTTTVCRIGRYLPKFGTVKFDNNWRGRCHHDLYVAWGRCGRKEWKVPMVVTGESRSESSAKDTPGGLLTRCSRD